MEIKVNKFTGAALANTIRQAVITRLEYTRPIAFRVGNHSNVLTINDSVEEDMTEFISAVCANEFLAEEELVKFSTTASGIFNVSEFSNDSLKVQAIGPKDLLHMNSPNEITVYFRTAAGKYTAAENEEFLQKKGVDTTGLVTIVSRHNPVSVCTCNKIAETADKEVYDITAVPRSWADGDELVERAIQIIRSDLSNLG